VDDCEAISAIRSARCLPNVKNLENRLLSLKELSIYVEYNLTPRTDNDINDLSKLWKELALHESLEYLNYVLSERGFPFKPGEKTIAILNTVLTKFSTSQAYYFIYAAAKNASDFYQLKNVSILHAANTIPGKISSLFDRAVSENWDITKYSRNYKECPPSALNNVLYDKVIGFAGFDYVPGSVLTMIEK